MSSTAASAPTSFEGNYGKIIYRVRAFIDTPRFAKDYKTEKPFYLLSLFNLNKVPDIQVRKSQRGVNVEVKRSFPRGNRSFPRFVFVGT